MKTNSAYSYVGIFLLVVFLSACVKDTDFSQSEDIVVSPNVELDLVYFDLPATSFFDPVTSTPILTVKDTTGIPWLNDEEIRSSMKRIEFYFKINNSIQREFQFEVQFLTDLNEITYTAQTPVISGSVENPVVTEFTENVEGEALDSLTLAEKIVFLLSISSPIENLEGAINLESKATYYLEL